MPLVGAGCKFMRREPVEARMRPPGIIVDAPRLDYLSGMGVAGERRDPRKKDQELFACYASINQFTNPIIVQIESILSP